MRQQFLYYKYNVYNNSENNLYDGQNHKAEKIIYATNRIAGKKLVGQCPM